MPGVPPAARATPRRDGGGAGFGQVNHGDQDPTDVAAEWLPATSTCRTSVDPLNAAGGRRRLHDVPPSIEY